MYCIYCRLHQHDVIYTETVYYISSRAARVHKDMHRTAMEADRKWNNTQSGETGPIADRLKQYGPIKGYVFGYLGEASQDVRDEISAMAAKTCGEAWAYPIGKKLMTSSNTDTQNSWA